LALHALSVQCVYKECDAFGAGCMAYTPCSQH